MIPKLENAFKALDSGVTKWSLEMRKHGIN